MKRTVATLFPLSLVCLALVLCVTRIANSQGAKTAARTRPQSIQTGDGGWPRGFSLPSEAQMVIFQPQVASWEGQKHLVAMAAVSYVAKGEQKPAMGTVKLEADTSVALTERLGKISTIKVTETNFQTLSTEQKQEITNEIDKAIPDEERVIGLDRVITSVDKSLILPKNVEGLKSDPPKIFMSRTPAILVGFDGEPIWSPIKDLNDLKFAVNTNWDLFQYAPTNTLYLRNDASWLKASAVTGPWTPAGKLPESFKQLPATDDNWKDVV